MKDWHIIKHLNFNILIISLERYKELLILIIQFLKLFNKFGQRNNNKIKGLINQLYSLLCKGDRDIVRKLKISFRGSEN
jgi:hypothetical protein